MAHEIVGSYRLVSLTNTRVEGTTARPYGSTPGGQIMFTPEGHMSVIVTAAPDATDGVASLAFSGTWDIEADVVTYHVMVSVRPEQVGGDQQRRFRFEGSRMVLNTPDGQGEIVWERLPDHGGDTIRS